MGRLTFVLFAFVCLTVLYQSQAKPSLWKSGKLLAEIRDLERSLYKRRPEGHPGDSGQGQGPPRQGSGPQNSQGGGQSGQPGDQGSIPTGGQTGGKTDEQGGDQGAPQGGTGQNSPQDDAGQSIPQGSGDNKGDQKGGADQSSFPSGGEQGAQPSGAGQKGASTGDQHGEGERGPQGEDDGGRGFLRHFIENAIKKATEIIENDNEKAEAAKLLQIVHHVIQVLKQYLVELLNEARKTGLDELNKEIDAHVAQVRLSQQLGIL